MLRTEQIDVSFNLKLQKDLQEHEVICSHCGGTGLQVDDNPFGLRKEGERPDYGNLFPHKKQTIVDCRHCYSGVQNKCLHCNEILDRQKYQCDCEKSKYERDQMQYEKDLEIWNKAKKISFEEASEKYIMLYIDNHDKFVNSDELEDWLHDENFQLDEVKSLKVYGTHVIDISIDAYSVIEDACSDLHEDAMDNIGDTDEKELQDFLNKWCEKNKQGTTTYYADFNVGILL